MEITVTQNSNPNKQELADFFEVVFMTTADQANFSPEIDQKLADWFSIDAMADYLPHGTSLEVRLPDNRLIGAMFIAKQNPITWPDGNKLEIFILGVDEHHRGQGVAKKIMAAAEQYAKNQGAKSILVNAHALAPTAQTFYKALGFEEIGTLRDYYDNGNAVFFQKKIN